MSTTMSSQHTSTMDSRSMVQLKERLQLKASTVLSPTSEVKNSFRGDPDEMARTMDEIEKILDGLEVEEGRREQYRAKLLEIKTQAPCAYQEEEMMRELENEVEFEKQKQELTLHLVITPELAGDGVHQRLIKRMVSFHQVYKRHVSQTKEMEAMGIFEERLTAKEKHRRLVIERKKVINDQLKLLLISLAMNGNRELQ